MEEILLRLTIAEAHIILRALATHNEKGGVKQDGHPCTWLAERLLRILSPELGVQPIDNLMTQAGNEPLMEMKQTRKGRKKS